MSMADLAPDLGLAQVQALVLEPEQELAPEQELVPDSVSS
jgi:hypothetical protein